MDTDGHGCRQDGFMRKTGNEEETGAFTTEAQRHREGNKDSGTETRIPLMNAN